MKKFLLPVFLLIFTGNAFAEEEKRKMFMTRFGFL